LWGKRYSAKRYIFNFEASTRVGEMMRDCVDLMVDNIEFARAPYETCYFELDTRAMWAAWRPDQPTLDSHDVRVGFLVHDSAVLVLVAGEPTKTIQHPTTGGIMFRINRPQSMPWRSLVGGDVLSQEQVDAVKNAYIFGGQRGVDRPGDYSFSHYDNTTRVFLPQLPGAWTHTQVSGHFDVQPALVNVDPRTFISMCFLGGGDPLTLTTMLLLLNQPSKFITLEHIEPRRGIFRGQPKTFKEHHIVTLHLDRKEHVRRVFQHTDRATPVAHPVSGHWKHYNKAPDCGHHHPDGRVAWEPVGLGRTNAGDYKRYWCSLCLQRRTWVDDFHTGDAGRGHATIEYDVRE
jgi:hypothetical protein